MGQTVEKIVQAPQQIVETIAPAPVMAAPIAAPIMSAPIVETFGAGYGAPVVETISAGYGTGIGFGGPSFATAPVVGSISAGLPMTTMAAPTVSMGAPLGTIGSPVVGAGFGYPSTVW